MIPVMLMIGLTLGGQPLIAYNYAAKNKKRMLEVIRYTTVTGTIICVVLAIVIFFASPVIVESFVKNDQVIQLGTTYLKINMSSIPLLCIIFLTMNVFQAMGKAIPSLILSIARQGIVYIPLIILLNSLFREVGLVWAQPVADYLCIGIGIVMFFLILKRERLQETT